MDNISNSELLYELIDTLSDEEFKDLLDTLSISDKAEKVIEKKEEVIEEAVTNFTQVKEDNFDFPKAKIAKIYLDVDDKIGHYVYLDEDGLHYFGKPSETEDELKNWLKTATRKDIEDSIKVLEPFVKKTLDIKEKVSQARKVAAIKEKLNQARQKKTQETLKQNNAEELKKKIQEKLKVSRKKKEIQERVKQMKNKK